MVERIKKLISSGKPVFFLKHVPSKGDSVVVYNGGKALKFSFLSRPVSCTKDSRIRMLEIVSSIRSIYSKKGFKVSDCGTWDEPLDYEIDKQLVLEQLRYCKQYEHLDINFSVTIDASYLLDGMFISEFLASLTSKTIINIKGIRELSTNPSDSEVLKKKMFNIRKSGVSFCIEGFMLGNKIDLYTLNFFDWEFIKIPRSYFLKELNNRDLSELTKILSNEQCKVIIEGIDKPMHYLAMQLRNSMLQGDFIGKPMKIKNSIYYF
ncbi:EAL domain-containing protein, partial [Vibrio panuliri]